MTIKVLVVEDDLGVLDNLKALLATRGYKVFEATDGLKAVEIARRQLPDLVLLDILLPQMGGIDVLKILKSNPPTQNLKIVMVSALSQMGDVETAFQNGAADYIIKPFDAERLFKKIDKVLGPDPSSSAA